MTGKKIEMFF